MSYNGYNQYSPYWQPTAGQTTPHNASQSFTKPENSYQPLSAYQNNQQPSQTSVSQPAGRTGGAYSSQGYGNVNMDGAASGRPQDSMAGFTNANDRASIDGARALGNLAYASSLGRDTSTPQVYHNNRHQSNANYGTANPYGVGSAPPIQYRTGDERRGSSGSTRGDITRSQQATASPSFGYSANNSGYQEPSAGTNTQAHPQYSQPSRFSTEQHKDQYSQPSRPPSGPAIQQSHARLGSQAAPSPTSSVNLSTPSQGQVSKNSSSVRGNEQIEVHTPQSDKRPSSSQVPMGSTQESQVPQATMNSQVDSASKRKAAEYSSAKETAAKRINEVRQSPAVDSGGDQVSKPATPAEPQYTTVDPSQIFNHMEYSRRQAAAAAEAAAVKKAAEEAEAAEAARFSATQPKPNTSQADGAESDSAKKDQMELEMKQMIEKMRDYKAKDPSLFTQIWEQVKKSQPPQRAPSKSIQGSATSPIVINGQSPTPSLVQNQLPPESDLPAGDEFPPDFDRGRFPAQRRKRGNKMFSTSRKSTTPKGSIEPAAENHLAENNESPAPPEIAIPTPKIGQIFPDPGSQSMREAMHQFHQNSTAPVAKAQQIPEPNKQATANTSTRPPNPTLTASHPQSVPAQSAPPPKPGGTYWPESKKKALAEAAQIALTSTPPNQAKTITTQEIHELLDQNPSYNQMCEILEYRGFVIDRGHLARVLLKAVPDLGSTPHSTNAASTHTASNNHATSTNATPTVTASNNDTTMTAKPTSATPTTGSFGKLVKATSKGSAAPKKVAQPLPYSVPSTAAFQAPNGYNNPYVPGPPSAEQVSERNPSNGLPRQYRFVPASWTVNEPRYHANVTDTSRPNESASHFQSLFSINQHSGSINGQVLDQNGTIHLKGIIPHHLTKQEMARKRSFGEIVDLAQTLSDDEELERHRPKSRIDNESTLIPSKSVKNIFNQVAQRQYNSGRTTPKPFKYKYSGRDALLQSNDIVEPMNKRRDALRRSTYNAKTIARDVLLGLGKHPTMAPLNAHLDVLRDRFKAVDYESDLSTFRWDLVDPEGEANAELPDTDNEAAVPAITAVARQRPAPIAVMIDGDGGIAKDDQDPSRTVNSKDNPYKRGLHKNRGIPSEIQPLDSADTSQRQSWHSSASAHDRDNVPSTNTPDLTRFAYNSPYTAQTDFTAVNAASSSTPNSASKRIGRPPGAKNKQVRPDKGIPKKIKTPSTGTTPSKAKAKQPEEKALGGSPLMEKRPPVRSLSTGKPSVSIPTGPRLTTTTPSKPSGLRSSTIAMTQNDGIAVVIPSRSPSVVLVSPQTSAKKDRPKKAGDFSNGTHASAPSYTMYRCRWENCPAELHNLETLKKHVRKHRQAVDDVYPCLWAECSDSSDPTSNDTQNKDGQHKRLKFKTDGEWVEHVESKHLRTGLEDWN